MTKRLIIIISAVSLLVPAILLRRLTTPAQATSSIECLPGLNGRVSVVRDKVGVPHITAASDHDLYFVMGYLHAQDRFFEMDVRRRQGSGALAELLGAGPDDQILDSDVVLRLVGLDRAAERSLGAYSPEAAALLQAYSDGVNVWLDRNQLPPEYAALEITRAPRWKPVDSIVISKLIQFQFSFDVSDLGRTTALLSYQAAGEAGGFDGARLFFEDIFRAAPFDTAVTIPRPDGAVARSSPEVESPGLQSRMIENARRARVMVGQGIREATRRFVERYQQNPLLNRADFGLGSNWWVIAGSETDTGNAMLANDPHLPLVAPATFYEIHLTVEAESSPMNLSGVSHAGVPGVFLGHNDRIAWGAAVCSVDVIDFFTENLIIENGAPVATRYRDRIEPLVTIPQEFKVNQIRNGAADDVIVVSPGDRPGGVNVPAAVLVVPRRNNGAIIAADPAGAVSVQYTGASATRDLEGIFAMARARNLSDFKRGLQSLEVGSLSWAYADIEGNIGTFVNGKIPLREDLQAGTIDGLPPFFLRDGTGAARNEWIPENDAGPGVNYESLPFEEMPQTVNPSQGFLVNANNDPVGITLDNDLIDRRRGEGLYYISSGFTPGIRAAKITGLIQQRLNSRRGRGKVSFQDMMLIQSNVQMFDAEVFTPYIDRAFRSARRPGAPAELAAIARDPAIEEAVRRLSNWDFSTPTGIFEGYDAWDRNGLRQWPSGQEISNSIAATIYSVWRTQIVANTIAATLRRAGVGQVQPGSVQLMADLRFLLDNFSTNRGIGASGLDFFEIPGIEAPPEARRDALILKSLKDALNLLAGDAFAEAFGRSSNQNDYRWGRLHRITFGHVFGGLAPQFSVPTAGNFVDLAPGLPGLATDGGFETIDNAHSGSLIASSQAFVFSIGPARRYIGELCSQGIRSVQIIPGGESGVADNRFYTNQLSSWLTNDYHAVLFTPAAIDSNRYSKTIYNPTSQR